MIAIVLTVCILLSFAFGERETQLWLVNFLESVAMQVRRNKMRICMFVGAHQSLGLPSVRTTSVRGWSFADNESKRMRCLGLCRRSW
jgi:hypothetical protein